MFSTKVYNIPEGTRTSKGRNLVNLLQVPSGEKIKEVVRVPKSFDDKFLIFATERGIVKKTPSQTIRILNKAG